MQIQNINLSRLQNTVILAVVVTFFFAAGNMMSAGAESATPPQSAASPEPNATPRQPDAGAQNNGAANSKDAVNPSPTPTPSPRLPSLAQVKVVKVENADSLAEAHAAEQEEAAGKKPEKRNAARLQEIIIVSVRDLRSLVLTSKCLSELDQIVPECTPQSIGLFLDGRHIEKIVPESGAPTLVDSAGAPLARDGKLQFHLQRNADSDEAWADLLGAPWGETFFERPTEVSVGLENGHALPTEVKVTSATTAENRFWLVRIHKSWFIFCSILLFLVLGALVALARHTELLRDLGPTPSPYEWHGLMAWWRDRKKLLRKPYSLARFQMAFWFALVVGSFLFIWLITGADDTINGSTLALIGIGAGTALGSATIDAAAANPIAAAPPRVSQGFLTDILTDHKSGISFHRFQMFVWTLVLGTLFIYSVWSRLSMPEFSSTLLAMLGISSGTYLGFKIPEQQQPAAPTGGAPTVTDVSGGAGGGGGGAAPENQG